MYLYFYFGDAAQEDDGAENQPIEKPTEATINLPDLSIAVEKRIEGKTVEAIKILRKFNSEYPDSHAILLQLLEHCLNQNNLN